MAAAARPRLLALVAMLVVLGIATPAVVTAMHTASTPLRVTTALALLMPAGFLMGMVFPIAMTLGVARAPGLAPWLWGINGAASVCASVLAVAIASTWGITAAWWAGTAWYAAAAALLARASQSHS